jgi:colanic acid biosynthesis glycosyl transferase WcaI
MLAFALPVFTILGPDLQRFYASFLSGIAVSRTLPPDTPVVKNGLGLNGPGKGPHFLRILLHGINYSPELTGIGKYSGEMAEWLAARGHGVRVVTAPPYYPAWRVRTDYRAWSYKTEPGTGPDPVRVYRCPIYVPRHPSGHTRLLHLGSFMLSSLPIMLSQAQWCPDVVLTIEPSLMSAVAGLMTARIADAVAWLHIQDFEVDAAFGLGLLQSEGRAHKLGEALERQAMHGFDHISTVSEKMMQRLPEKGVPIEKTVMFPNWVDTDAIAPLQGPSRLRHQLGLGPDRVVLMYAGNMGMKQGLEVLPLLAQEFASDPRIHFVFCGDGAYHAQLAGMVRSAANVTMLPLQPFDRLNDLLNAADIHLLPQRPDAADLVMPSKLTGMLASGRPVIATAASGTQVAIALRSCGVAVPPLDNTALFTAVHTLADRPEMRHALGVAARAHAVEHLGRERVLERFEGELLKAVGKRHSSDSL